MESNLLSLAISLMFSQTGFQMTELRKENENFLLEIDRLGRDATINKRILDSRLNLNLFTNTQYEILSDSFNEVMNEYANGLDRQVERLYELKDLNSEIYILGEYSDTGYAILHLLSGDFIEIAPFAEPPINMEKDPTLFSILTNRIIETNYFYLPLNGVFAEKRTANIDYVNVIDGTSFGSETIEYQKLHCELFSRAVIDKNYNEELINNIRTSKKKEPLIRPFSLPTDTPGVGNYPIENGMMFADKETPYSWYFKKLANQFAYGDPSRNNGSCGYVATGMLLSYAEFFSSGGYFSDAEREEFVSPYNGPLAYGEGIPLISDSLVDYLYNMHQRPNGTTPIDSEWLVNLFAGNKNKVYEHYMWLAFFATPSDPIKDGVPAILYGNLSRVEQSASGRGHAVVAYGYYNNTNGTPSNRFLVHWGWDYSSQIVMNIPGIFDFGGVYALYNKSEHVHSVFHKMNYEEIHERPEIFLTHPLRWIMVTYKRTGIRTYCGCGHIMEDTYHEEKIFLPKQRG